MLALALSLTYTRSVPLSVRYALIMPYTVIINVAACRVFRDLRLSAMHQSDSYLSNVISNLVFAAVDDDRTLSTIWMVMHTCTIVEEEPSMLEDWSVKMCANVFKLVFLGVRPAAADPKWLWSSLRASCASDRTQAWLVSTVSKSSARLHTCISLCACYIYMC